MPNLAGGSSIVVETPGQRLCPVLLIAYYLALLEGVWQAFHRSPSPPKCRDRLTFPMSAVLSSSWSLANSEPCQNAHRVDFIS